tara:strand:+ start:2835 stop:3029 length:195 start_codon:yes stop_codon:yes gene_type:complete
MFKAMIIVCMLETGLCILLEDDRKRYIQATDCKQALFDLKVRARRYFNYFTVVDEKCIFVGKET